MVAQNRVTGPSRVRREATTCGADQGGVSKAYIW